jgi:hypothetical protein
MPVLSWLLSGSVKGPLLPQAVISTMKKVASNIFIEDKHVYLK